MPGDNPFIAEISALVEDSGFPADEVGGVVTSPPDPKLGDYALPCFVLSKAARRGPAQIAGEVAGRFRPSSLLKSANAAGPYVNFFVEPAAFIGWALSGITAAGARYGGGRSGRGNTVIVEFSSPNIAKPLGVHALRPTMIGHALRNIYRALDYRVVALNHLGDWGTQFGQLIAAYQRYGGERALEGDSVSALNAMYVRFHRDAENDASMLQEGRDWFKKLEQGDPEATALWERFRAISLAEFKRSYEMLGVGFDSFDGEAYFRDKMDATIERIQERGIAEMSEGALIVNLEDYKMPPCLLRKSDGATLYATRDLCAAEYRKRTYDFANLIYVVGSDQKLHFRQLFKVLELMGYDWAKDCVHVDFGLLRMDAGKMSTRRGRTILLEDVLREAVSRVRGIIQKKNPDLAEDRDRMDAIARQVGIGAVVFAQLRTRRNKDIDFDWDEVLNFEGETGPYLQYSHVRLCSILRKADARGIAWRGREVTGARLEQPEELALAREMAEFPAVIRRAGEKYEPSLVCTHLLELCGTFNRYYHNHRVLADDGELAAARLRLVDCLRQVIANGLDLLGIPAPEEM